MLYITLHNEKPITWNVNEYLPCVFWDITELQADGDELALIRDVVSPYKFTGRVVKMAKHFCS